MAGELTQEINQLKIKISNDEDVLKRLKELLSFAEHVNRGDVSPALEAAIVAVYQEINQ